MSAVRNATRSVSSAVGFGTGLHNRPMLRLVSPEIRHWRKTRGITALLLAVWFLVTFGVIFFARELGTALVGWHFNFSFWMAAQGAVLVYALLVWCYVRWMARLDRAFGLSESE